MWAWELIAFAGQLLGMAYGVIAVLESFGRRQPAGWQGTQGSVIRAVAWSAAGMLVVGAAIAAKPASGGTLAKVPATVLMISIENAHFMPAQLNVPAGQPAAVIVVNHDTAPHSFDVDALGVHVGVSAQGVVVAELRAPAAGDFEYDCAVPGHKAGGMVGTVHAQ